MTKVTHVITGMGIGGAEMMLAKLVTGIDRRFESRVISLSSDLSLADRIRAAGVEVISLDTPASIIPGTWAVWRLVRMLRRSRPDVVQTWLHHADLLGGIAARLTGLPVVWNVQSSTLAAPDIRLRTIGVARACAATSRFIPRKIVSCSYAGADSHVKMGYTPDKFTIIHNGADLDIFKPDPDARAAVRAALGIGDERVIAMVARLHPLKDHANFFAAAADLVRTHPDVRFVLAGQGMEPQNNAVMSMVRAAGVERQTILLGARSDVPRLLPAFDVHTLSSSSEGFPNVLVEAMASGVPCVATDAGDSAVILGDTGRIARARDPKALANAWREMLDLPRERFEELRVRARERVASQFSLRVCTRQYEAVYDEIVAERGAAKETRVSTKPLRVLALAGYPVEAAATRFRVVQFRSVLARHGINVILRPFLNARAFDELYDRRRWLTTSWRVTMAFFRRFLQLPAVWRADVIFLQREAMLVGPPVIEWIATRLARRPMILDLDDATYLEHVSQVYGSVARFLRWRGKADRLIDWAALAICGNERIAEYVRARGTPAVVMPSIVDPRHFSPRLAQDENGIPVIGWIGSHSTFPYFESIIPALEDLAKEFRFRTIVVGSGRDEIPIAGVEVEALPWNLEREVDDFRKLDIGVYPLPNDIWAEGKSGLKAFEYLAVGVPFVASPVGIVGTIGRPGETHLLADTPEQWRDALAQLLRDAEARRAMGKAAREYAVRYCSVEEIGGRISRLVRVANAGPEEVRALCASIGVARDATVRTS